MARRRKSEVRFVRNARTIKKGSMTKGTLVVGLSTRHNPKRNPVRMGGVKSGHMASGIWRPKLHPRGPGGKFIKK